MKNEDIQILVKKLEKYFHGYSAQDRTLVNDSGMKLSFNSSWNNKTEVTGIGGKYSHSIGCSFTKSPDKISKDIKRRLLPSYRDDFIKAKREKLESEQFEAQEMLKLQALEQACSGTLTGTYWNSRSPRDKYIDAENMRIKQNYSSNYEFSIELNFSESLKLIELLNQNNFIEKKAS